MIRRFPTRMCLGCRGRFEKSRLVRVGRSAEGVPFLDAAGTGYGRGAYVCAEASCIERGLTGKNLSRALRLDGAADSLKMRRALSALRDLAVSDRRLAITLQIGEQRSG